MSDLNPEPNTEQIAIWRNLLDAFGQLSSAWDTASEAHVRADEGEGPGTIELPEELIEAFALAGARGSEALAGVADVLAAQSKSTEFQPVADAEHTARQRWADAHSRSSERSSGSEEDAPE